jgi:hypothetical protein
LAASQEAAEIRSACKLQNPKLFDCELRNLYWVFDAGLTDLENLLENELRDRVAAILEAQESKVCT